MNNDIRLIVIDVDGTLTDSGIYYDNNGNELKKFSTKDAAGFFAAQSLGIKTMVLTGRECEATVRRMEELKVDYLVQNIKEKAVYLDDFMRCNNFTKEEVAYIGDDLNDIASMQLCGFIGCPFDSCDEVKCIADYVSEKLGGHGAVRDIIVYILKEMGMWNTAVNNVYGITGGI